MVGEHARATMLAAFQALSLLASCTMQTLGVRAASPAGGRLYAQLFLNVISFTGGISGNTQMSPVY